ncbi:MAG: Eco57I restriction-modification methylase domain-containing protein, partial [Prolixibacteraceae bacterium]
MESIQRKKFNRYIENFQFAELFNQLGWDFMDEKFPKRAAGQTYNFHHIANKAGFAILICLPDESGLVPDAQTRKKIHTEISRLHHEHLIIFVDEQRTLQYWELLIREANKPTRTVSHKWTKSQAPELLYQKLSGAFFSLEEDEAGNLTIIDVVQRIKKNFGANAEKVTKRFYQEFKKQHTAFLDFIEGIDDVLPNKDNTNKQWYASLMLNRLMFCYFIQRKGFLDQDKNYLQNKLAECKKHSGEDKFYSFYRSFLIQLFHDGLGKPENHRKNKTLVEMGNIPYLNGGLFDVHELEKQFDEINIKDDAFEKIFDFFDDWNWHLDTRTESTGKDINPDVIGYIFEKYINDRAAMGAYYTKEDITDYIGKNTIIPFLFDETERKYKEAFLPGGELWETFKTSGDTYIYDAVKYGVPESGGLFDDLPGEIQAGFQPSLEKEVVKETTSPHLWEIRKTWNQRAPENIALPTEIYRELIERRKRYADVKSKIESGEITAINDFITYNLNIRQFAQDYIETTRDPVFIRNFYKALNKVTILDPTCGSGAFLFAAMNILEPLYETCINRMEEFTEEQPGKNKYFEEVLEQIDNDTHPNLQYFIFKSIILNNLYGVDIMKEAVEIAKLRLFLKLVATVGPNPGKRNYGMEPLPDIDFNIRAGNTLVGFATEEELFDTIKKKDGLFAQEKLDAFKEEMGELNKVYKHFQDAQLINNQGSEDFRHAKAELQKRLKNLNHSLNIYLATNYGIDANKKPTEFKSWLTSHQPFHWFAEFYQIVAVEGGFDVIIGNPPYVFLGGFNQYSLLNFDTISTKNLYSLILERCQYILNIQSLQGYIVPISSTSTEGYLPLQKILKKRELTISCYDDRPSHLFTGLDKNTLSIILVGHYNNNRISSTRLIHWMAEERKELFEILSISKTPNCNLVGCIPKIGMQIAREIWNKLISENNPIGLEIRKYGQFITYYSRKINSFIQVLNFIPEVKNSNDELRPPSEFKPLRFSSQNEANLIFCAFNSSLFRWFLDITTDGSHLNKREVEGFHLNLKKLIN